MKHLQNLFIAALSLIAITCAGMEKEQPILREITAVNNPYQAFFLTNNKAVINGEGGCSIVDLNTNKEIKKLSESQWKHLILHPDKTTLALYNREKLEIFDTQTEHIIFKTSFNNFPTISAVFGQDSTIYLLVKNQEQYDELASCDYKKPCPMKEIIISGNHSLVYHPIKQRIHLAAQSYPSIITVLDNNFIDRNFITKIDTYPSFFECNNDGSWLAVSNLNTLYLLDANHVPFKSWAPKHKLFKKITFHPNNLYVAILCETDHRRYGECSKTEISLRYQDLKRERIHWTTIKNDSIDFTLENSPSSLSFDPDGKHALITLYNKCFSIPVPFEVVYQDDAKEKAIFAHLILKDYKPDSGDELPHDITQHIMHTLLEASKR